METLISPFDSVFHAIPCGLLPYFQGQKDDLSCIWEPKIATQGFPNASQVLGR